MLNPTNFKITVAISECHVLGMQIHAGIDEGGGGGTVHYTWHVSEIFVP